MSSAAPTAPVRLGPARLTKVLRHPVLAAALDEALSVEQDAFAWRCGDVEVLRVGRRLLVACGGSVRVRDDIPDDVSVRELAAELLGAAAWRVA